MKFLDLQFTALLQGDRNKLPPFLGATLRGALGYLLKQTVCQVAHGECARCVLWRACAYPSVFEGIPPNDRDWMRKYPRIPQPFVLVVGSPHEREDQSPLLQWSVRLFGGACRYWPYVLHVFQMAGEQGIGRARIRYSIESVRDGVNEQPIVASNGELQGEPQESSVVADPPVLSDRCALRWRFVTPTRLADRRGHVSGLSIILAGRRRLQLMKHFHDDPASPGYDEPRVEEEDFVTEQSELRRFGFSRFSGRQQQSMELTGLMGEIVIQGPWRQVPSLLSAIPKIHLGKSTSFGFGRVEWELV